LSRFVFNGDFATVRTTKVVLAAAHLDHDPSHNTLRNLKALCQRCHLRHDSDGTPPPPLAHHSQTQGPWRLVSRSLPFLSH
jgi:5-methylcytosine-specific restriction endonuclease McrA